VFKRIEAKGYRCLKEVSQELRPFEILVGSNASGKSTFLDVVGFLSDYVSEGLATAIEVRTSDFHDLVWGRKANSFEIGVQVELGIDRVEYDIEVRLDVEEERRVVLEKVHSYPQDVERKVANFRNTSTLVSRADENFPSTNALRDLLIDGVRTVSLDAEALAIPNRPGSVDTRKMTGGSLARQIEKLKRTGAQYQDWLSHVRTALPDVCAIDSLLRPEDHRHYVVVEYKGGVRVPSWMLSEGTLRLLALTILAYLPDFRGVYLIEEPENGVHPTALETIYQSLSSIYEAQVLVASHSPVLLSMAKPEQILCFSKTEEGTKIVRGSEHPALKEWQGEVSLGTLAASGILG
jgi:predicted ATPase